MTWLTITPPIIALIIAIWRREVILALIVALFAAEWLLSGGNPASGFTRTIEQLITVLGNAENARILMFSLLIGAILAYISDSGGVTAFVEWLTNKNLAKSPRQVSLMTTLVGIVIFIESNLSVLTAGILSQRLFDKFHMSRARLAYIIDSTCAPISVIILLNAWGALLLALLEPYHFNNAVAILLWSIPFNFYAILAIVLVFYTAITGKVHGPLKHHEKQATTINPERIVPASKLHYMLVPIATMVFGMVFCMWLTGNGNIINGSGSKSVLWATAAAVTIAYLLLRYQEKISHHQLIQMGFKGMGKLLPLVTTVFFAMALSDSLVQLGTGDFVASMLGDFLPLTLITPLVFLAAAIISFATGTSWGTFGILIPIGMPLALTLGIPPHLMLGAIIAGAIFGDHSSPISDSTILSSLASGCDHLDHVKTQLPYALLAAILSFIGYFISSIFLL